MSKITSKGQVTIPKEIRDEFGLSPGVDIQFKVVNGRVTVQKKTAETRFGKWRGILKLDKDVDRFIADVRGDHDH